MSLEIIPAIIPEHLDDLSSKLERVVGIAPIVQIDFVDGIFVPEVKKSWPFTNAPAMAEFHRIASEEEGMPFWDEFFFEVDLMVQEPEKYIDEIINAGFRRVILHLRSSDVLHDIIDQLHSFDIEVGIAIGLDDDPELIEPYVEKVDVIQCMGIAHIGKQGELFDARVLAHISTLRGLYPDSIISIDGGVTTENAPLLVGAGADRLISGSAIFGSEDIEQTLNNFYSSEDRSAEIFS